MTHLAKEASSQETILTGERTGTETVRWLTELRSPGRAQQCYSTWFEDLYRSVNSFLTSLRHDELVTECLDTFQHFDIAAIPQCTIRGLLLLKGVWSVQVCGSSWGGRHTVEAAPLSWKHILGYKALGICKAESLVLYQTA